MINELSGKFANEMSAKINEAAKRYFKIPDFIFNNGFLLGLWCRVHNLKIELKPNQTTICDEYTFIKGDERVGSIVINKRVAVAGSTTIEKVQKGFCEFLEKKMKFGIEPLTGFPCELSEEQKKHEQDVAWGEFEQILKKYL